MASSLESTRVFGPAIGAITGGLSLFKLASLLWGLDYSRLFESVIALYESALKPIRVVLGPVAQWVFREIGVNLPEGWVHVVVLWLVVGGITVRALESVDRELGRERSGPIKGAFENIALSSLGIILLLLVLYEWIKREVLYWFIKEVDGYDYRMVGEYTSPWRIILREILVTLGTALTFVITNAFLEL